MVDREFLPPLFGLNIDPSTKNVQLAFQLAKLADEVNLDMISIQDHPYNPQFLDTWTLLTALGISTQHVHLLTNVTNLPLRPPAMLAKTAATLDVLTHGRVELGLGAGAATEAIASYGGPQRTPGEAVSALEEALQVLRTLWQPAPSSGGVSFSGQYYQLTNAQPGPEPAHPIHIWLGALRPRLLRITGQLADGLLISSSYIPPENVLAVQHSIDEAADQAGRKPTDVRRGYNLMGAILQPGGRTVTSRRKGIIIGPVSQWVDEIVHYYNDLHMDTFVFWPVMGEEEKQARLFAEEIIPAIRAATGNSK